MPGIKIGSMSRSSEKPVIELSQRSAEKSGTDWAVIFTSCLFSGLHPSGSVGQLMSLRLAIATPRQGCVVKTESRFPNSGKRATSTRTKDHPPDDEKGRRAIPAAFSPPMVQEARVQASPRLRNSLTTAAPIPTKTTAPGAGIGGSCLISSAERARS